MVGVGRLTQWTKALPTKPDDFSSLPETHDRKTNQLGKVSPNVHMLWYVVYYTHKHIHNNNSNINNKEPGILLVHKELSKGGGCRDGSVLKTKDQFPALT